jgi:hypothetical protein
VAASRLSLSVWDSLTSAIDHWRNKQDDEPSRPEAIRRLVELGLTVKTPARPASKAGRRLRAQELATKAIEIIDPAAPPEERAQRRRRLTKGPPEFREARVAEGEEMSDGDASLRKAKAKVTGAQKVRAAQRPSNKGFSFSWRAAHLVRLL